MAEQYFHFTLGPVQEFVSQARRTRDFWAGSFVLSWLSAVAMLSVRQQGGKIEFPIPDESYLKWMQGNAEGAPPAQGSIPNRFKAARAVVPENFDPHRVVDAVQSVWLALADLVWQGDLDEGSPHVSAETKAIWERQIAQFWDINWVLTDASFSSHVLDSRKNWRAHYLPDEPGVKCMMMSGWQELSGSERPGKGLADFWSALRLKDSRHLKTDLREGEYLSAVAYIKRRFVHYFHKLSLDIPVAESGQALVIHGWKLPVHVPSTNYLAAAPWLAKTLRMVQSVPELGPKLEDLQADIQLLEHAYEGPSVVLEQIEQAALESRWQSDPWHRTSGRLLYSDELSLLAAQADDRADEALYLDCAKKLGTIEKLVGAKPSDFYATLLMDGDLLGSQMSHAARQTGISRALNRFTQAVPALVKKHSGFLVYAGGDDVLALLSVDNAIDCAESLRKLYDRCFHDENKQQPADAKIDTSLSGALLFGHYKSELTGNLQKAHALLDDVAKETAGRNSLAIQVWKPGGLHCQWAGKWEQAQTGVIVAQRFQAILRSLAELESDSNAPPRKFFFKVEELVQQLGLDTGDHPFDESAVRALLLSAWMHAGSNVNAMPASLLEHMLDFLLVPINGAAAEVAGSFAISADPLHLLHFLYTQRIDSMPISAGEKRE